VSSVPQTANTPQLHTRIADRKGSETTVLDSSISHYREVMATNLDSVYYCARAAGLHWRRQALEQTTVDGKKLEDFKKGSFVATASMSGHIVNFPHIQTAYNASKAGVIHMCKNSEPFPLFPECS
jgi:sorbose reductase